MAYRLASPFERIGSVLSIVLVSSFHRSAHLSLLAFHPLPLLARTGLGAYGNRYQERTRRNLVSGVHRFPYRHAFQTHLTTAHSKRKEAAGDGSQLTFRGWFFYYSILI